MDYYLKENLLDVCECVTCEQWDWLHLNSGMERSGKSAFSLQQAIFCSNHGLEFPLTKELPNLFFYEKNLSQKMMHVKDQSVVIIDEGAENLFSRNAFMPEVKKIIQTIMIYGAKNIFLIINVPDWRWVDVYIRQSRVRSLAQVYTRPLDKGKRHGRKRGFFELYNRKQVLEASRSERSQLPDTDVRGRFDDFSVKNPRIWEYYSNKKRAFLESKKVVQKRLKPDYSVLTDKTRLV